MTSQLVYQRIRNRIIEMLEWIIECESTPPEGGMNELINSWEDWVPLPTIQGYFPSPVFTSNEDSLLSSVSDAIDKFCEVTPKSIEDDLKVLSLPQWTGVILAAKEALAVMQKRGMMSEEEVMNL